MKFQKDTSTASQAFLLFTSKLLIFLVLIGIFSVAMLPDLDEVNYYVNEVKHSLTKTFKEEKTKVLMLSFIQNPDALYKLSEIEERKGSIHSAIRDIELAIGLLEMHGADKQITKRYSDRARKLKALESMQPNPSRQ